MISLSPLRTDRAWNTCVPPLDVLILPAKQIVWASQSVSGECYPLRQVTLHDPMSNKLSTYRFGAVDDLIEFGHELSVRFTSQAMTYVDLVIFGDTQQDPVCKLVTSDSEEAIANGQWGGSTVIVLAALSLPAVVGRAVGMGSLWVHRPKLSRQSLLGFVVAPGAGRSPGPPGRTIRESGEADKVSPAA